MDKRNEEWRPIEGYEGAYSVSSSGRVLAHNYRNKQGVKRCLRDKTAGNGYRMVTLWKARRASSFYVHRLVVEAFRGPIAPGLTVNHLDGDKANNGLRNLEVVSYRDNQLHARRSGLCGTNKGVRNGSTKLTPADVREIRELLARGDLMKKAIAAAYGVAPTTVSGIAAGRTWSHVT